MKNQRIKNRLEIYTGDITRLRVDAIVNAANTGLAGGGGVDGAIHHAAGGEQLQAACRAIGGCPTGEVRVTPGFNLPAKYIFHAVGPIWRGGGNREAELLASCYRNALLLTSQYQIASIAFPAISCGVYGYPLEQAAACAVQTVAANLPALEHLRRVVFCCFDSAMAERYRQQLAGVA